MSQIIKTEAFVLSKLNYGNTSIIASLFSRNLGRFSVIVKGARSEKSKIGKVVDPMNLIEVIIYKKESREIQLASSADLISHYSNIKEDVDSLRYCYAILELLRHLLPEHEENERIFKGLLKIFDYFELKKEEPVVLFGRFFLFFLSEIGYEFPIEKCASCGRKDLAGKDLSYNYEMGILCSECRAYHVESMSVSTELFSYLNCLKYNKTIQQLNKKIFDRAVNLLENHLKYHVSDFKGIQSIKLFNH